MPISFFRCATLQMDKMPALRDELSKTAGEMEDATRGHNAKPIEATVQKMLALVASTGSAATASSAS
jgi:hypothetical protein